MTNLPESSFAHCEFSEAIVPARYLLTREDLELVKDLQRKKKASQKDVGKVAQEFSHYRSVRVSNQKEEWL